MSSETTTSLSISKRQIGQVKWFNNKAGYGFITMKDESGKENDIFTHYSTVKVGDSQYKYLVQGEYVEFELSESTNKNHKFQATNITGIQNGKLMCETRQISRSTGRNTSSRVSASNDEEHTGFTKVVKRRVPSKK
jgi:cold shock CspA family protein